MGEEIRAARLSARRNQRRFWATTLIGAVAVAAILGVSVWMIVLVRQESESIRGELDSFRSQVDNDLKEFEESVGERVKRFDEGLADLPAIEALVKANSARLKTMDASLSTTDERRVCGGEEKDRLAIARCLREQDALWPAQEEELTLRLSGDFSREAAASDSKKASRRALLLRRRAWARRYLGGFLGAIEDLNEAEQLLGIPGEGDGASEQTTKVLGDIAAKRAWMRMRVGGKQQLRRAFEDCELALSRGYSEYWVLNTRGFLNFMGGMDGKAADDWRAAEELRAGSASVGLSHENIALVPLSQRRWQEVLDLFGPEQASNPRTAWTALFIGIAQMETSQFAQADANLALWSELRRDYHVPWLKSLLPEDLHPYIEN